MAQCIYPFFTKSGSSVPCGRCPVCLETRVAQWVFRFQQEEKHSDHATRFVTMTYAPEHLYHTPNGFPSLYKKHVQDFMKRLRHHLGKAGKNVKYYAVGEYGHRFNRPHYHILLFHMPESMLPLLQSCWPHGNVFIGTEDGNQQVNSDQMGYVGGYIQKGRIIKKSADDDRLKEFSLMSKGLGLSFSRLKCRDGTMMMSQGDMFNLMAEKSPSPVTMLSSSDWIPLHTLVEPNFKRTPVQEMIRCMLTIFADTREEAIMITGTKKMNAVEPHSATWLDKNF